MTLGVTDANSWGKLRHRGCRGGGLDLVLERAQGSWLPSLPCAPRARWKPGVQAPSPTTPCSVRSCQSPPRDPRPLGSIVDETHATRLLNKEASEASQE